MVLVGFTFQHGDGGASTSGAATTSTAPTASTTPAVLSTPTSTTSPAPAASAPAPATDVPQNAPASEPAPSPAPTTEAPQPAAAPAPTREYLYGPDAGFPRSGVITVGAAIDAPALGAAIDYWNTMAGRTIFVLGGGSPQITVGAAEGVCNAPSVACSAPASVYDHAWHPDMKYPYESCAVYVLAEYAVNWWTIAHELGHCLGFDHITDRASIMNSPPNPDPTRDRDLLVSAGYVN